jgi:hypothetical protein
MENQKLSKLQFYSLGIVAMNKKLSVSTIEVTPVEEFPLLDGEITDNTDNYKSEFKNAQKEPFNLELKTTATVKAKWLPINNSNRRTSPDVRRGEHVILYRFADTDEYWWNTLQNDNTLRRLETVIYSFNNLKVENIEDTADTSYWLEVSTHKKLMHVHTSKNDGEPFAYDIQINAKDGKLVITDDANNFIVINSKDSIIRAENTFGTFVEINKNIINMSASEAINMITPIVNMTTNLQVNGSIHANGTIIDDSGNTNHHKH